MANEKFSPHIPTVLQGQHLDEIHKLWGVSYDVSISLPEDEETPETGLLHGLHDSLQRKTFIIPYPVVYS